MWLVVVEGGQPRRAVEVGGGRFTIGRAESCDLVLDDERVSREHAVITPGPPGRRILQDLDSANGTLVNGRPIPQATGFSAHPDRVTELWGDEQMQFGDTLVVATTRDPSSVLDPESAGSSEDPPHPHTPPRPDLDNDPSAQ
jgi:pSer/pThr/pTyr-binding forkhead associated (FHA) protein